MISTEVADDKTTYGGLSSVEAEALRAEGKNNAVRQRSGKSYKKIVADNLFTFFNMVWAIVSVILIAVGSFSNLTFLAVVIPNIAIATFIEIRAKLRVERLSVTTEPKAKVVRDGELIEIDSSDIVLGDLMYVEIGHQVLSDGEVVDGVAEANESMLTGEADAIKKQTGDKVLAGSYLVSGAVYVKVTAVGKDNYVHTIEKEAKSFKAPASNLFRDLNSLIKYIGIFMVPMTVLMFINNWIVTGHILKDLVEKTSGSVIGMIPAGAYLLVTIALSLSVISLLRKHTLVQDMYSIEMLASADVLCLDKTGTITDGTMEGTETLALSDLSCERIAEIMAMVEGSEQSINNTSRALIDRFGKNESCIVLDKVPFSSKRKYSAVSIEGEGVYAVGAPHFVRCPVSPEVEDMIAAHAERGERVLLLAKLESIDGEGVAIALIAISDRIRPNAADTIAKFQEQGVTVKVISGDHAATVSSIAKRVGIAGAEKYLSCENLSDEELTAVANDYTVYGRVTPEQKVLLVKTLRAAGHTVAMTGDGVNDTLALKESDCSVAMADGSEVARKVSKIVLMNSDFGSLPDVVKEGRRCINNVRMSSVLFLMKTIFTILLSIIVVCTRITYPFQPKQLSFLELFIIGLGSLLLTLEPNNKRIEGSFIKTVLIKSAPNALTMLIPVVSVLVLQKIGIISSSGVASALATVAVTLIGLINLVFICYPYTKWRIGVIGIVTFLVALSMPLSIPVLSDMMQIAPAFESLTLCFGLVGLSASLTLIVHIARLIIMGVLKKKRAKKA